jgi:5S rRNA maturation endonuclease (ribonuclease M5)
VGKIDFQKTVQLALSNARTIVEHYLPGGKYEQSEYVVQNPTRTDAHLGSFKINVAKGVWSDFAADAGGSDLISLVAYIKGVGQAEAAKAIMDLLGIREEEPRVVATFIFHDAKGKALYFKERVEPGRDGRHKEFRFYHKDGRKRQSGRGDHKVLYNLPAVLKSKYILFVEGEAKADLLNSWGLTATSLDSGAKSKLTKEMIQQLAGKRVVILPDNDQAGAEYADYLAATLHGQAEALKIVQLPGLKNKEDIIEWAAVDGNDKDRLVSIIRDVPEYSPAQLEKAAVAAPPAKTMKTRRKNEEGKPERVTQNEIILNLMEGMPLLVDDTKTPWTFIDGKTIPVQSHELADWLTLKYFRLEAKAPSTEALNSAVKVLAAKARIEGEKIALFNRVARKDDDFWYDLGEGRALKLKPTGWEFTEPEPLFQRWAHMQPQPDPLKGGDPWDFLRFCHIPEENRLLIMTTLITSFVPGIAHPLWHVTGPQGSGKSSFCRLIKRLVDPSAAELQMIQPEKETDLFLVLYQNYVLVLENLSSLSGRISDLLCGAVTGATVSQRVLHTNTDMVLLRLKNIVILNGITPLIQRADLMDRTITIELGRIPSGGRKLEGEIFEEFDRALPGILGGIFSVLCKAMGIYPTVTIDNLPRLADFAKWGYAVAEALGGYGERFLADYTANGAMQNDEILGQSTLANALIAEMEGKTVWETTAAVAWKTLREAADPPHGDRTFPAKVQDMRKYLERLRVSLAEKNISFNYGRHTRKGVALAFYKTEENLSSQVDLKIPPPHSEVTSNSANMLNKTEDVKIVNTNVPLSGPLNTVDVFFDGDEIA